ncbi:conjugal transfer protein, partial [Neisseria sicca]
MNTFILHDTRPYPQTPVKNHLLVNASLLAHGTTAATRKIAVGQLQAEIRSQLQQNYYVNLSVAMTMAPDAETYNALMQSINQVLSAENDDETQWFALPVVIVAGCKQERTLSLALPTEALTACLSNYPHLRALTQNTQWLPFLTHSDDLSGITPEQWWNAKQNSESAAAFLQTFEDKPLICPEGQSVHVVYALGYGDKNLQTALGVNLQQAGLPLMQVWQESLAADGVTLFTNPLSPNTPLQALTDGSHTRQRMAMDVFATNAIRAIRMQSPRVGVVIAARAGGQILFGFNATDSAFEVVPQVFVWNLSSS